MPRTKKPAGRNAAKAPDIIPVAPWRASGASILSVAAAVATRSDQATDSVRIALALAREVEQALAERGPSPAEIAAAERIVAAIRAAGHEIQARERGSLLILSSGSGQVMAVRRLAAAVAWVLK